MTSKKNALSPSCDVRALLAALIATAALTACGAAADGDFVPPTDETSPDTPTSVDGETFYVTADVMPAAEDNHMTASEEQIDVVLYAPEAVDLASLTGLRADAMSNRPRDWALVPSFSEVELRDVDGDGVLDGTATFEGSWLRGAGLIGPDRTCVIFRITAFDGTRLFGGDHLLDFDVTPDEVGALGACDPLPVD